MINNKFILKMFEGTLSGYENITLNAARYHKLLRKQVAQTVDFTFRQVR